MSAFGAVQFQSGSIGNGITDHVSAAAVATAVNDLIVVAFCQAGSGTPVITDTVGNTYKRIGAGIFSPNQGYQMDYFYCLSSIGANAANVVKGTVSGNNEAMNIGVRNVTINSGFFAAFDQAQTNTNSNAATAVSTAFSTSGLEALACFDLLSDNNTGATFTQGSGYTLDSAQYGTYNFLKSAGQHQLFSSVQSGVTASMDLNADAALLLS